MAHFILNRLSIAKILALDLAIYQSRLFFRRNSTGIFEQIEF